MATLICTLVVMAAAAFCAGYDPEEIYEICRDCWR